MTDQPESSRTAPEPGSPPNDPASPPAGDSSTSVSPDVDAIVKAVLAHPDYQKDKQSVKDKRIAEIQNSLGEQDQRIARLARQLGVDPSKIIEAERQIQYEDNMEWIAQQRQNGGQVSSPPASGNAVDLAKARDTIMTQMGLTEEPKGMTDYLAELDWTNPVDAALKANAWVTEKQANQRQPTAADKAPPPTGVPASSLAHLSNDELGDKLSEYQTNPGKYAKERALVMEELARRR